MDFGSGARSHLWFRETFQIEERGSSSENFDFLESIMFLVVGSCVKTAIGTYLGFLYFELAGYAP